MNTVAKRLLTFFIGVPVLIGLVFLTYEHHLALNIAVVIFAVLGANEFYNMVQAKTSLPPKSVLIIFSGLIPLLTYLLQLFNLSSEPLSCIFFFILILLMAYECLTAKEFTQSFERISFSALCILYCGFGMSFITRISFVENSLWFILFFLSLVVLCDSAAWFFGMLFGKNNRGLIKASPNKSIAGFLGGIFSDILLAVLAKIYFPDIFTGNYISIIILALLTAFAAIIGDLIESVFKRSCNIKDSGNIVPGRGGILDSIDSFIVAGPVFYLGIYFLYLL